MPESSSQASQRRANWVGLRTLRQHPKVVGETESGEPIFEVRSVRLLLRPEGSHFHLLTECSKCGRGVAGSQVFSSGDLDRPSNPVICTDCVRKTGVATYRPPEASAPRAPAHVAPEVGAETVTLPDDDVDPGELIEEWDDGRLARVEARTKAALTQVKELADVQRSESIERRRADEATQSQLQQALHQYIAEVRAELTSAPAVPDEQVGRNLAVLADAVQGQRADIAQLSAALAESQQQMQRVVDAHNQLAAEHADLQARVAQQDAASPGPQGGAAVSQDVVDAVVERRLQDVQRALAESVGGRLSALESAVADGSAQARFEVAALDQRVDNAVVALTQMVETQRRDLDSTALAQVVAELAEARARVEARLDDLAGRGQQVQAGIDALASAASTGAERVDALDRRTQQAVSRLTASIEAQRRASQSAPVENRPPRPTAPPAAEGDLLDDLERQLQQAEGRLARLSMPGGDGD